MERHIQNLCVEYASNVIRDLGAKYNFDAEEAISGLELPTIKRTDVVPARRRKEVTEKTKKETRVVPSIPLPFCGVVNESWCNAIIKNNKLFTQCTNKKNEENKYCKKCSKLADKEGGNVPFGEINTRLEGDVMEFTDPKGVKVVPYSVIMKKLNITQETAETEAAKFGWTINPKQFVVPEKSRGRPKKSSDEESSNDNEKAASSKRGRPKKDKPMKASSQVGDDIIAGLLAQANADATAEEADVSEEEKHIVAETVVVAVKQTKAKTVSKSNDDKAVKQAEKDAAKAAKAAEKATKDAEKAAAKAAEKAAKDAEKAAKDAEKAAAPKADKIKATKNNNKTKSTENAQPPADEKKEVVENSQEESDSDSDDDEEVIKVKKFEFEGKKYKRSEPDNVLYDWDTNEPIGIWNPKTNKIEEINNEDEDEEDDE